MDLYEQMIASRAQQLYRDGIKTLQDVLEMIKNEDDKLDKNKWEPMYVSVMEKSKDKSSNGLKSCTGNIGEQFRYWSKHSKYLNRKIVGFNCYEAAHNNSGLRLKSEFYYDISI